MGRTTIRILVLALVLASCGSGGDKGRLDGGGTGGQHTIDLAVSVPDGTLGGPYACGTSLTGGPSVRLEITSTVATGFSTDCSITIEQAGKATEHARGTFSGSATGDGVDTVTAGTFDIVVMPQGG